MRWHNGHAEVIRPCTFIYLVAAVDVVVAAVDVVAGVDVVAAVVAVAVAAVDIVLQP